MSSMSDVAASEGYYMAMAAGTILAENLTLTGSIGVVTGKFNLAKLYEKIGFNKEILSKGKFAELIAADQRPFRPDEAELFKKSAENAYKQFRDKAAFSRSMPVEKMEEVAQGRVWTGQDAASRGLVDAIGGFSRAIVIAKQKAGIPLDNKVTLVTVILAPRVLERHRVFYSQCGQDNEGITTRPGILRGGSSSDGWNHVSKIRGPFLRQPHYFFD